MKNSLYNLFPPLSFNEFLHKEINSFTAEKAKIKSVKGRENAQDRIYESVIIEIMNECSLGNYSFIKSDYIGEAVTERLIAAGFVIEQLGLKIKISWQND